MSTVYKTLLHDVHPKALHSIGGECSAKVRWKRGQLLPDNIWMREFLKKADFPYNAVLVHVIFVYLHNHHLAASSVCHLKKSYSLCSTVLMGQGPK